MPRRWPSVPWSESQRFLPRNNWSCPCHIDRVLTVCRTEEEVSREKALQTVVAGQQAENLLDFDADDDVPAQGLGLGDDRRVSDAGIISSKAIASAAKASNPLDELMDLFSTASMNVPAQTPGAPMAMATAGGGMGGMGMDLMSPTSGGSASSMPSAPTVPPGGGGGQKKPEEDLLGLF